MEDSTRPILSSSNVITTSPVEVSRLRGSSARAVYRAMFELLDGRIKRCVEGELEVATEEGRYRFIDGVCFEAPVDDHVGGTLAGWLIEAAHASAVLTRWRRGAVAVLVREPALVHVAGPTLSLTADGPPLEDGFATHDGSVVFEYEDVSAAHDSLRGLALADSRPPASPLSRDEDPEIAGASEQDLDRATLPDASDAAAAGGWDVEGDAAHDRRTLPPSERAQAMVTAERLRASEVPPEGRLDERRSNAAPPAWQICTVPPLDPLPDITLELVERFDDDGDRMPHVVLERVDS